jgi:hypothetical protein
MQTADSGFIVTGRTGLSFSRDIYLVKTDADGNTLWSRTYGGAENDEGKCVRQTTDGGYIITGFTDSFGAGLSDLYLIRTDINGDTLWNRTYGGTGYDCGNSVLQTADGGFIVAGYNGSILTNSTLVYLIKVDANGDSLWTRTYGTHPQQMGESIQPTFDGGYIISGWTGTTLPMNPIYIIYLVKTDANGDTLWTDTYGYGTGYSVQQTADGGYAIAGFRYDGWLGPYDMYLIRLQSNSSVNGGSPQPLEFSLDNPYPNPFNASATIGYKIPIKTHINIDIYNVLGQKTTTLLDGVQPPGHHTITWNAADTPSGIYFLQIQTGNYTHIKKVVLLN